MKPLLVLAALLCLSAPCIAQTRPVRVIPTTIQRDQNGTITVELTTTGNENAISFTLTFDPAQLTYIPPASGNNALLIGPGMPSNSAIVVNDTQLNLGRLGFLLSAPFGQVIPAGARQILTLTFMAPTSGSGNSTSVGFGTTPMAQELTDAAKFSPSPSFDQF